MAGATHPFFGNQYTNGGYIVGSFKFPEGLTREVGERLAKTAVSDIVPSNIGTISPVRNPTPLDSIIKTMTKSKWIIPTLIIAAIAAAGSYFAYRNFKKKGIVKIPNVGICEFCGEPLTGAKLIPNDNNPYIVCKKCGERNFAKYSSDEDLEDLNGGEEGGKSNGQRRIKEPN